MSGVIKGCAADWAGAARDAGTNGAGNKGCTPGKHFWQSEKASPQVGRDMTCGRCPNRLFPVNSLPGLAVENGRRSLFSRFDLLTMRALLPRARQADGHHSARTIATAALAYGTTRHLATRRL